jgi:lipid-A-disaccharide synthase
MGAPRISGSLLVVAGEASADAHGARVVDQLGRVLPGVECFGLGRERLKAAGLSAVADADALRVVGISEALRGLSKIRGVFKTVIREVERRRPSAALLIDLPDFNLRLARRLKKLNVPVVYYVAPQAWAWRRGRVRQLRRRVHRLCVVFPFEEEFFLGHGVPAEFVGHPLTEEEFPHREERPKRVAIVPGSRPREIERLLPALAGAARILKEQAGDLEFVLPLAPGIEAGRVRAILQGAGVEAALLPGGAAGAVPGSRLALVTSGTATLESALAGVPMVVVYRVSRMTYLLVRPIYRLPHVCIVNILAGRGLVPELLQGRANAGAIARAALPRLEDGEERSRTVAGLREVVRSLGSDRRTSERVAGILAGLMAGEVS